MSTNAADTGDILRKMIEEEIAKQPSELERRIIANRVKCAVKAWITSGQTPPEPITPMTDQEALTYENERMEFGKYNGVKVKDVPLNYLAWVADAGRKSWRQITAYLQSNRIKSEMKADGEP